MYDGEPNTCRICKKTLHGPKFGRHLIDNLSCKKELFESYYSEPLKMKCSSTPELKNKNKFKDTKFKCSKCNMTYKGYVDYFQHGVRFALHLKSKKTFDFPLSASSSTEAPFLIF